MSDPAGHPLQTRFTRLVGCRLPVVQTGMGWVSGANLTAATSAAGGFGITPALCQELLDAGDDLLTTGNHVFDQREILGHISGWHREMLPALERLSRGEKPIAAGVSYADVDAWNAKFAEAKRGWATADILRELLDGSTGR